MKLQVCGDGNFTNHALCGRTTNILGSAADFDHPLFWGLIGDITTWEVIT